MSLEMVFQGIRSVHGDAQARNWLRSQQKANSTAINKASSPNSNKLGQESVQESYLPHSSHIEATQLLEPFKNSLGAAYKTLHLLARWSIENATENDPAPHLMTCYWTLEEALGINERTIRRHLVEQTHTWSNTVKKLIDVKINYGEMLDGKTENGKDKYRTVISNMVIRFFPKSRLSKNARVKRWGRRDLLADSDEGRTKPTRPEREKMRYNRQIGLMSAYSSIKEQNQTFNWLMVKLGQTVSDRVAQNKNYGNLYADIPTNHVLDALYSDLNRALEAASARGANKKRTRSMWVNTAAKLLAERHGDNRPLPHQENKQHVTHYEGFTNLWRKILWTAIKADLYGATRQGWLLVRKMITLASEAKEEGKTKPSAWAWSVVREELNALHRDFGANYAGEYMNAA